MAHLLENVLPEDRLKVHQLCQKQLGGVWNDVTETQLIIQRFAKGEVNQLFYCELPDCLKQSSSDKYNSVVVKLFATFDEEMYFDPFVSVMNDLMLSQKMIAPKVYRIFNGGVISEFIDGRSFTGNDDKDKHIVRLLAQKLAKLHSIQMPLPKDSSKRWLNEICVDWFNKSLCNSLTEGLLREEIVKQNRKTLLKVDFGAELRWMKKVILASNCPLVYSHCDFNRGNILIRNKNIKNEEKLEIFLIDFDFSSYNYRGIDTGRYFSNWAHKDPNFGEGEFPTDEQMSLFINAYIEESVTLLGNCFKKLQINSKQSLIKEAKLFTLFSYLIDVLFCLWTVNADISKSQQYLQKGETRFNGFCVLKNKFIEENSIPRE